jgi:hypothetical protein
MKFQFVASGLLAIAAIVITPAASAADLNGKWTFAMQTEGGERSFTPEFKVDGQQVTGKWGRADISGKFVDNKLDLSFPFTSEEGSVNGTLKIAGTMNEGSLAGTWQFEAYQGSFKAVRAGAPATPVTTSSSGIAGNWECKMEADRSYPFLLSLIEDAGVWKGKAASDAGELPLQTVKVEQNAATFTINVNSTTVAFKLRANGGLLDGTWEAGGNSGAVKGVRK